MSRAWDLLAFGAIVALSTGCALFTELTGNPRSNATDAAMARSNQVFIEASNMSADGRCGEVEAQLARLEPEWLADPLGSSAAELLITRCKLFWYGDTVSAREHALRVMEKPSGNWSSGATQVATSYFFECAFDPAMDYAYRSIESRDTYTTPTILEFAARILLAQGRPDLAARNARQYLDGYPRNWYRTPAAEPPEGVSYHLETAEGNHYNARAGSWLILVRQDPSVRIPADEIGVVKTFVNPDFKYGVLNGPDFLRSDAGAMYSAERLRVMVAGLAIREQLGLTPSEVDRLAGAIRALKEQVQGRSEPCSDAIARTAAEAEKVLAGLPGQEASLADGDIDSDGILNGSDSCPQEPEVLNGIDDGDGCPDQAPVAIVEKQIVISDTIRFKLDSAELLPESLPILQGIVALLKMYPQVKWVQVEGHTDARGTPKHNQQLSEARARSVKEYLVGQGIEANRLSSVGYGDRYPVAFGNDEKAWSVNRRVEFLIVQADPIRVEGGSTRR